MEINSRCMGCLITLVITNISAERARKTVVGRKVKEKVVRKTYVSCVCVFARLHRFLFAFFQIAFDQN